MREIFTSQTEVFQGNWQRNLADYGRILPFRGDGAKRQEGDRKKQKTPFPFPVSLPFGLENGKNAGFPFFKGNARRARGFLLSVYFKKADFSINQKSSFSIKQLVSFISSIFPLGGNARREGGQILNREKNFKNKMPMKHAC